MPLKPYHIRSALPCCHVPLRPAVLAVALLQGIATGLTSYAAVTSHPNMALFNGGITLYALYGGSLGMLLVGLGFFWEGLILAFVACNHMFIALNFVLFQLQTMYHSGGVLPDCHYLRAVGNSYHICDSDDLMPHWKMMPFGFLACIVLGQYLDKMIMSLKAEKKNCSKSPDPLPKQLVTPIPVPQQIEAHHQPANIIVPLTPQPAAHGSQMFLVTEEPPQPAVYYAPEVVMPSGQHLVELRY